MEEKISLESKLEEPHDLNGFDVGVFDTEHRRRGILDMIDDWTDGNGQMAVGAM